MANVVTNEELKSLRESIRKIPGLYPPLVCDLLLTIAARDAEISDLKAELGTRGTGTGVDDLYQEDKP